MANVTFRSDGETDRALAELTHDGTERSEAIRQALIAEARRRRHERLRAEAVRLSADPAYQAEVEAARAALEELRAW